MVPRYSWQDAEQAEAQRRERARHYRRICDPKPHQPSDARLALWVIGGGAVVLAVIVGFLAACWVAEQVVQAIGGAL